MFSQTTYLPHSGLTQAVGVMLAIKEETGRHTVHRAQRRPVCIHALPCPFITQLSRYLVERGGCYSPWEQLLLEEGWHIEGTEIVQVLLGTSLSSSVQRVKQS